MWNVGHIGPHQADWTVMKGENEYLIFLLNLDSKLYGGRGITDGLITQGFPFFHQHVEEI